MGTPTIPRHDRVLPLATVSSQAPKPTVAIITHGCKLNQADSSVLAADFVKVGYRLVDQHEAADVYVVNTCTVTHVADRKARQALRSARRRNPDANVVAAGCYAQRAGDSLRAMPEVDLVAGNTAKPNLVSLVEDLRPAKSAVPANAATGLDLVAAVSAGLQPYRNRAMVKIQEGCNQVCAYCIVPRVRGRERSVPPGRLVRQVAGHVEAGAKEVVLTGTQLGSYGFELDGADLAGMIERVLGETEVPRLRVSSLQPQEIDARLLDLWSDPRLCPHFHLALQSGSDAVLSRMRRRYSASEYLDAARRIRDAVPDASLTTDVIAGFPGETSSDFEQTHALCERVGFAAMHVFPYSVRPGTSAAHYRDRVAEDVKRGRTNALLDLSELLASAFRRGLVGSVRPVLWESRDDSSGRWTGLTDTYVRVSCRSERPLANEIAKARLGRLEEDGVVDVVPL